MLRSSMTPVAQVPLRRCNGTSWCPLPVVYQFQRRTAAKPVVAQMWEVKGCAPLEMTKWKQSTWRCSAGGQDEQGEIRDEEFVQEEDLFLSFERNPLLLVLISTIFNGGLLLLALVAGKFLGLQILEEFIFPRDVVAGLGYTIPLLASMLAVVEYGDLFSGIREIKSMLQKTILPVIRKMPIWGPFVLALGAGLGEEAMYRALLQTYIIEQGGPLFGGLLATGTGIAIASLLFGLGHALNKVYFWWATLAGALFGIEYVMFGLPSAAFTHALYDWIALVFLANRWSNTQNAESVNNDS